MFKGLTLRCVCGVIGMRTVYLDSAKLKDVNPRKPGHVLHSVKWYLLIGSNVRTV